MAVPPPRPAPDNVIATKAELRRTLRDRRRDFVAAAGAERLAAMHRDLLERVAPALAAARLVSAYAAVGDEIDPLAILHHAAARGARIALPRVTRRAEPMTFHLWAPGEALEAGPLGLVQPPASASRCEPDLILTPLLGFDRALGRIGQGAGYYDRAFAACPAARRIGLAWSVQEVDAVPLAAWDVPLHGIATEREWIAP